MLFWRIWAPLHPGGQSGAAGGGKASPPAEPSSAPPRIAPHSLIVQPPYLFFIFDTMQIPTDGTTVLITTRTTRRMDGREDALDVATVDVSHIFVQKPGGYHSNATSESFVPPLARIPAAARRPGGGGAGSPPAASRASQSKLPSQHLEEGGRSCLQRVSTNPCQCKGSALPPPIVHSGGRPQ